MCNKNANKMRKIMFNDDVKLTDATISGDKTNTRREEFQTDANLVGECLFTKNGLIYKRFDFDNGQSFTARYAIGEVVAVAQSYKDCGEFDVYETPKGTAGWTNKMFVKADLMPHHIQFTGIRCERLQDISEEDCINEGVVPELSLIGGHWHYHLPNSVFFHFHNPVDAFSVLIDKVSGRGTWERNPWVIAYEFVKVD